MGYIYKITNKINGKSYIGQTKNTIKIRMNKHYSQAKTGEKITGIDAAIRKYGKDNFIVEEICQCRDIDLDIQEQFYIKLYDTFNNGYNLTIGGQNGTTSLNLNELEVIQKYYQLKTIKAVSEYYNCCEQTISNILKNNNIKLFKQIHNVENLKNRKKFQIGDGVKPVRLIELNLTFPSMKECSQWLIDNNYSKASTMQLARKSLSRVLNGDRKTYCGFHFEFI